MQGAAAIMWPQLVYSSRRQQKTFWLDNFQVLSLSAHDDFAPFGLKKARCAGGGENGNAPRFTCRPVRLRGRDAQGNIHPLGP
jgi:hypothetical protein